MSIAFIWHYKRAIQLTESFREQCFVQGLNWVFRIYVCWLGLCFCCCNFGMLHIQSLWTSVSRFSRYHIGVGCNKSSNSPRQCNCYLSRRWLFSLHFRRIVKTNPKSFPDIQNDIRKFDIRNTDLRNPKHIVFLTYKHMKSMFPKPLTSSPTYYSCSKLITIAI